MRRRRQAGNDDESAVAVLLSGGECLVVLKDTRIAPDVVALARLVQLVARVADAFFLAIVRDSWDMHLLATMTAAKHLATRSTVVLPVEH